MRFLPATLLLCLLACPALASEPPDMNGFYGWHNRMTGYQAAKEPRWAVSTKRAGKWHVKAKHARRSPARRMQAPHRAHMAGVVAPLAAKAREIVSACGSKVISAVRHTRIAGTGGRLSLHASGRAIDIQGNPSCIYSHLRGWPGGVSTDYGRVRHVHFSYAPGGPEWGVRFQHGRSGHRHKRRRADLGDLLCGPRSNFDHFEARRSCALHHVGGAASAGKRDDKIGPAFIDHPLIADRASGVAVHRPVSVEAFVVMKVAPRRPSRREIVGTFSAAFDDAGYRDWPEMDAIKLIVDALNIRVIAAAADENFHKPSSTTPPHQSESHAFHL